MGERDGEGRGGKKCIIFLKDKGKKFILLLSLLSKNKNPIKLFFIILSFLFFIFINLEIHPLRPEH